MDFYEMLGGDAKEYIEIDIENEIVKDLKLYTDKNELQFLNREPVEISISEEGGIEYPDCKNYPLPLFSEKLKTFLDKKGVENIFYKPVYLIDELLEERHLYWLAVVPVINCFDRGKKKIVEEKTGNYKIFRAAERSEELIFVEKELKEKIEEELKNKTLQGIVFYDIND